MKTRCKELGTCQARYPFAPGIIEGPEPEPQGPLLAEAVLALVCVAAVVAVVSFACGFFSVPGVLL